MLATGRDGPAILVAMSTNPYATGGAPAPGYEAWEERPGRTRTSALAVASLILSILCLTSPLGVILGVAALFSRRCLRTNRLHVQQQRRSNADGGIGSDRDAEDQRVNEALYHLAAENIQRHQRQQRLGSQHQCRAHRIGHRQQRHG